MNPTEHNASPGAAPKAGFLASRCVSVRPKGTRAPRIVLLFALAIAAVAFSAAPAFAAAPETPELSVEAHVPSPASPATEAVLLGVLNPHAAGEAGTYEFIYAAGSSCEGGSATVPGVSFGVEAEALPAETIAGLTPGTLYTVCLRAINGAAEPALSTPVSFTTAVHPETPVSREAKAVTGTSATLRGELNPKLSGTVAYEFSYNDEALPCEPGVSGLTSPLGAEQTGKALQVSTPVSALVPASTYTFCVVAVNGAGETAVGNPLTFVTPAAKPEVILASESTSALTPFEATFHAEVNANDQETTVYFQYSTGNSVDLAGSLEATTQVPLPPGSSIGAGFGAVPVEVSTGRHLTPGTAYFFQAVAVNPSGTTYGEVVELTTPAAAPPSIEAPYPAATVTPFAATLAAQVNPESEETSCHLVYGTEPLLATGTTTVPCEPAWLGMGAGPVSVAVGLQGLTPGTVYSYRFVAENETSGGTPTQGPIETFTTPPATAPVIEGESTSAVTPTEVTFGASVNPDSQASSCSFEYASVKAELGTPGAKTAACAPASLGSGSAPVSASATVSGLTPGTLYFFRVTATNPTGSEPGAIEEVTTLTLNAPVVESETATTVTPTEAQLETVVNPEFQTSTCTFEYGTSPTLATGTKTQPCPPAVLGSGGAGVGTSVILTGLEPGTAYYYRVAATNATGETKGTETEPIREFKTLALHVPVIESEASANITQTTATLEAQVNPEYQATPYTFEYATEESVLLEGHGTTVAGGELPAGSIQAGFGEHAAHAEAAGLAPDTLYFYRVAAHNPAGPAEQLSTVQSFTTTSVPLASTGEAQAITATAASLTATVNPSGLPTTYFFEYGHSTSYDRQAPFPQGTIPAGSSTVPVTVPLSGLEPGSTYHYRIVATNTSNGTVQTVQGEDETFTTTATPPVITGLSVGAVTQSSASVSATLDPRGLPTRWELVMRAPGGSPQQITSGETSTVIPLGANVGSLGPGTEYRYTLRATNSNGAVAPEGAFTTIAGEAAAPPAGLPALIPFTSIATIQAKETAEDKKNAKPLPLTNKQKLSKALKACHAKHGHKRKVCEAAAHKKYGPKRKGKG